MAWLFMTTGSALYSYCSYFFILCRAPLLGWGCRARFVLDRSYSCPTHCAELKDRDDKTFHYYWRVKSSLKLVWMESTAPCNSQIGYSLKWRCCMLIAHWSDLL
jgi:hypothetical protein